MTVQNSRGWMPSLDGIRGVAILLVLFHHLPVEYRSSFGFVSEMGGRGVDLFFCLSGFLMGILIPHRLKALNDSKLATLQFLLFRTGRIWPLYGLLLICIGLALPGIDPQATYFLKKAPLYYLTFFQNFHPQDSMELGVMWSLAVEEQFYFLLMGLMLFFGAERFVRGTSKLGILIIPGAMLFRFLTLNVAPQYFKASAIQRLFWFTTPSRIDHLFIGLLFGFLFLRTRQKGLQSIIRSATPWSRLVSFILIFSSAGMVCWWPTTAFWTFTFTATLLSSVILVLAWIDSALERDKTELTWEVKLLAPLRYAGKLCFGLYLLHPMTRNLAQKYFGETHPAAWEFMSVWMLITFTLATLSFYLLEAPALAWFRKQGKLPTLRRESKAVSPVTSQ